MNLTELYLTALYCLGIDTQKVQTIVNILSSVNSARIIIVTYGALNNTLLSDEQSPSVKYKTDRQFLWMR